MKRLLYILMLVATVCCYAQQNAPLATEAICDGWLPGYPAHYCECRETSIPFSFPLDVQVTDTMWYVSTVNDLRQGLSAYWFADCAITFEVYAFCPSKTPTLTMTVEPDQMHELDVATINRKLDEMGDMAELISQTLTPRVKVYPNGGTGRVYCYPYDQGPVSTCDDVLPVIPGMTYICDQDTEVYELKPAKISPLGEGFIRWKQKNNQPGTIRLTLDSCTGTEIANVTLADSMRVLILDTAQMRAAKEADRSVFVHVTHPDGYVGRIYYHDSIVWTEQRIDTVLCQGKSLQLADTALSESTVYPNDTLWQSGDMLSLVTYYLTIDTPEIHYDTLRYKASQLPTTYRNQYIPKDGWGDYEFVIRKEDRCDEYYNVHVEHDITTRATVVDTAVCLGKTISFGGVAYAQDTVIRDSAWADADTWVTSDITIRFTDPETEYDTISVLASQFTANGYWYAGMGVLVKSFGDTLIVKTKKNTCTRWVQLHVEHETVTRTVVADTVLCMGRIFEYGNMEYVQDTVIRDSAWADADTWVISDITVRFAEPETEYDTIAVPASWFTEEGYWYSGLEVMVTGYGDTLIVKEAENTCTRLIQLHVEERGIGTDADIAPAGARTIYKYMRNGQIYIRREGQDYDLLGKPLKRQ